MTETKDKRFVFGLWHGGASYAAPYVADDLERFASMGAAKAALKARAEQGFTWPQRFDYVHKQASNDLTPCADAGAYIDCAVVYAHCEADAIEKAEAHFADGNTRRFEYTQRGAIREA